MLQCARSVKIITLGNAIMLNKLCILVTRPQPQADELAELIVAEGGKAVACPTFSIEDPLDKDALQTAIQQLDEADIVIFVSPNAVKKAMPLLQAVWPKLPENLLITAVGKSTQKVLKAYGLKSVLCPEDEFNSEALLSLPVFNQIQNRMILIFQGETGRGLLENVLTTRGANVRLAICYRRVLTPHIPASTVFNWQKIGINCIVYTSAEGMLNLFQLIDESFHRWLKTLPSVVVSTRLAEIAKGIKIDTIIQSHGADSASIIEALKLRR